MDMIVFMLRPGGTFRVKKGKKKAENWCTDAYLSYFAARGCTIISGRISVSNEGQQRYTGGM